MLLVLDYHITGLKDIKFWLFKTLFNSHICTLVSLSWYNTLWEDIWVYTAIPVICIITALLLTTLYTSLNAYLLFGHWLCKCIIKHNPGPNVLVFYMFYIYIMFNRIIITQHTICWYSKPHPPIPSKIGTKTKRLQYMHPLTIIHRKLKHPLVSNTWNKYRKY